MGSTEFQTCPANECGQVACGGHGLRLTTLAIFQTTKPEMCPSQDQSSQSHVLENLSVGVGTLLAWARSVPKKLIEAGLVAAHWEPSQVP